MQAKKERIISSWYRAVRPFSFTASLTPVALGAVLALSSPFLIRWSFLPWVALSVLLLHVGTNLANDYFDFVNGIDTKNTLGSSGVLVNGLLPPRSILRGGLLAFALGFLISLFFIPARGFLILLLSLSGMLGGYFYTGRPLHYKYRALGDLLVFFLMGPMIVVGTYFTLTQHYSHRILWVSFPLGFLVSAILHANNLRDIQHDENAKIKTLAGVLGFHRAKLFYCVLILSSYVGIIAIISARMLPLWSVLVFFSFPLALKNMQIVRQGQSTSSSNFLFIDMQTAKLHFLFGFLLFLSLTFDPLRAILTS